MPEYLTFDQVQKLQKDFNMAFISHEETLQNEQAAIDLLKWFSGARKIGFDGYIRCPFCDAVTGPTITGQHDPSCRVPEAQALVEKMEADIERNRRFLKDW